MTEMLNKEFSRKNFVKGGGAMIVGFSVAGAGVGAKAAKAAEDPFASMGPYDQTLVDSWLMIHSDNTVSLKPGKVELGQGTLTGLLMIAAEELDVSMAQMKHAIVDTAYSPNHGATTGSQGIQSGGTSRSRACFPVVPPVRSGYLSTRAGNTVARASVTIAR